MPRPTAIEQAQKFRQQLASQEAQSAERMATVYARIYTGLLNESRSLAEQLAGMETLDRETVIKLARVQSLLKQVEAEVTRFGGTVQGEVTIVQSQAIQQGIDDALKLMQASLPPDLPPEVARAVTASFTRLHRDAIESAAGLMGADSPLRQQLEEKFGEYVAGQVESHFLDGIGQGMRADQITALLNRNLQNGLGSGLTSVLTTLRTAQIKSYQLANHATYMANSNVVKGWVWHAALDNNTCMSCVSQHGTVHELDETLDDHHNGRCAPIPQKISYKDLGLDIEETIAPTESGEAWFNRQPESVQRDKMGPGMFEAWKGGKFDSRDLSQKYNDPVYGELLRQASLKDLQAGTSDRVRVSLTDFTPGYNETLKEIEQIKRDGEFYDGELKEAQAKLEMEKEISAGLRDLGLSPARMELEDWSRAADKFQDRAFDQLTYATQAQRDAAGNQATGRRFVAPGERQIIHVGGQDTEKKWTGGSAAQAQRATQLINERTKTAAHEYMGNRLQEFGFKDADNLTYEQQRRLFAKIGNGEAGDVTPQQRADALEIAYNPRAGQGMKLWEFYEISMVKAGRDVEIQPPPDNRENYIPSFVTGQKRAKKVTEEIDF